MDHSRLVIKESGIVWNEELATFTPMTTTEIMWRGAAPDIDIVSTIVPPEAV